MRSLTLWPEWAWAVQVLGKRVENRPRPASHYGLHPGMEFAIHGGAHLGGRPGWAAALWGMGAVADAAGRAGVVVHTDFRGPRRPAIGHGAGPDYHLLTRDHYPAQSVVAVAVLDCCLGPVTIHARATLGPWEDDNSYRFRLRDVRPLSRPVPCTVQQYPGMRQGLWMLPGPVEAEVRAQLAAQPVPR